MKKWRCTVCGYIHVGDEPPEKCPVCGADKSKFEEVVEATPKEKKEAPEETAAQPEAESGQETETAAATGGEPGFFIHLMLRFHLHPISVHVPNGVLPVSVIFIVLATLLGWDPLGKAALFNMVFVAISLPFVLFSGYVEWKKRYRGFLSGIFIIKITAAAVVTATTVLLVVWWAVDPSVLQVASAGRTVFIFISIIMLAAAGIAGYIGGKLVFKD
jgi:hypothetical protein